MKFDNLEVIGFEHALNNVRMSISNPDLSDSGYCNEPMVECKGCAYNDRKRGCTSKYKEVFVIGKNDYKLMVNGLSDFRKLIVVYVDITATIEFWKKFVDILLRSSNKINPFVMLESEEPHSHRFTLMLNYDWLRCLYHKRLDKNLPEWKQFHEWIKSLPYNEFITAKEK